MDPLRIVVRAVFVYVFLLVMVRPSGKRTVAHGTSVDFVLALVFGDLVDDMVWAEVPATQFVVAAGTLFLCSGLVGLWKAREVAAHTRR
jgi:uncharacterized membrane protein YcaP (DUF421 family)